MAGVNLLDKLQLLMEEDTVEYDFFLGGHFFNSTTKKCIKSSPAFVNVIITIYIIDIHFY